MEVDVVGLNVDVAVVYVDAVVLVFSEGDFEQETSKITTEHIIIQNTPFFMFSPSHVFGYVLAADYIKEYSPVYFVPFILSRRREKDGTAGLSGKKGVEFKGI